MEGREGSAFFGRDGHGPPHLDLRGHSEERRNASANPRVAFGMRLFLPQVYHSLSLSLTRPSTFDLRRSLPALATYQTLTCATLHPPLRWCQPIMASRPAAIIGMSDASLPSPSLPLPSLMDWHLLLPLLHLPTSSLTLHSLARKLTHVNRRGHGLHEDGVRDPLQMRSSKSWTGARMSTILPCRVWRVEPCERIA